MNSRQLLFSTVAILLAAFVPPASAEVNQVETVAPNVYFHEGDLGRFGHCNNGWVILEDYVLVIDANFPSGARVILPKIRAQTDKPIRFAFDTHHHGDHAYANQLWHEEGAVPVAHAGALAEMRKYEPRTFGGDAPGRWEDAAKNRKDVAASKLKPPTLLFNQDLIFDDGRTRVELRHFGTAHTHGDGWAWLPKERILFSGDACVNGPYNYTGDGNLHEWIQTLERVKALRPRLICPGHGASGGPELIEDQQQYFKSLLAEVGRLKAAGRSAAQVREAVDGIKETLRKNERIARYLGGFFEMQVEKAWTELGGEPFGPKPAAQVEPLRLKAKDLLVRTGE